MKHEIIQPEVLRAQHSSVTRMPKFLFLWVNAIYCCNPGRSSHLLNGEPKETKYYITSYSCHKILKYNYTTIFSEELVGEGRSVMDNTLASRAEVPSSRPAASHKVFSAFFLLVLFSKMSCRPWLAPCMAAVTVIFDSCKTCHHVFLLYTCNHTAVCQFELNKENYFLKLLNIIQANTVSTYSTTKTLSVTLEDILKFKSTVSLWNLNACQRMLISHYRMQPARQLWPNKNPRPNYRIPHQKILASFRRASH